MLKSKWSCKTPLYLETKDKAYRKHLKQLEKRGFSDSETWNLDVVIAEFIFPRLKRFKELKNGCPASTTPEQWDEILDKMIFAFDSVLRDDEYQTKCFPKDYDYNFTTNKNGVIMWNDKRKPDFTLYDEILTKRSEGLKLFAEHFGCLWW